MVRWAIDAAGPALPVTLLAY